MRKKAFLPFRHEINVDNFAGGGGASTGMEAGIGRAIDIAINHDPEAIEMHRANHPATKHYCEDVFSVHPLEVTGGEPVGLAWFSPDCKHHSKAKGGKPVDKKIRGLAWIVIKWAKIVKPRVIMLENVEEFEKWGPLVKGPDGNTYPDKAREGLTFRRWMGQLKAAGYKVETKQLRACDYGAPTIRKRLFVIARCDGLPIVWPKPTHGPGLIPYRTAAECIDWSLPCPSIFERTRPLKPATLRRIANGIRKFVIESANPFIMPVTHHGADRGQSIDDPLNTVTGANRGEQAIVTPHLAKFRFDSAGAKIDEPMPTITAGGDMKRPAGAAHALGLVCPTLIQTGYGERPGQEPRSLDLNKPLGTVVADGQKHAVVAAWLGAASGPTYSQKPRSVEKPVNTLTSDPRVGVCAAFLAKHFGDNGQRPGSAMSEPMSTVTAVDHNALVTAHIQRDMGKSVGHEADKPLGTTTAGGGGHSAIVAAQLVGCGGRAAQSRPRDVSEPMQTQTSKADTCLVASSLVKMKGTCEHGQPVTEPLHTVQAGGLHFAEVRSLLLESKLFNESDRLGIVTIKGVDYAIVDIGMRMLQPHELFAAQGFPSNYIIAPIVDKKGFRKDKQRKRGPLSKTAQVRMCGNSVCPPIAEALVRANFKHEQKYEAVA